MARRLELAVDLSHVLVIPCVLRRVSFERLIQDRVTHDLLNEKQVPKWNGSRTAGATRLISAQHVVRGGEVAPVGGWNHNPVVSVVDEADQVPFR